MKKRLLSWLMVLTLCLTLLPTAALADTGAGESSGSKKHEHYLCGTSHTCANTQDSEREFTEWTDALAQERYGAGSTAANSLPVDGPASYYLTQDVELTKTWEPNAYITLCLNGHSITMKGDKSVISVSGTFTLVDCKGDSHDDKYGQITHAEGKKGHGVELTGGTFTMYGGNITGNTAGSGGGVYMTGSSTFNLYGGQITSNTATGSGGGVYSEYGTNHNSTFNMYGGQIADNNGNIGGGGVFYGNGTFTMRGGEISGNNGGGGRSKNGGGGVCIVGAMTVSGDVKITGNMEITDSGSTKNNVYLRGSDAVIAIGMGGLDGSAEIGVTASTPSVGLPIATGTKLNETIAAKFTSDNDQYKVEPNSEGTQLVLVKNIHQHYLCTTENTCTGLGGHTEENGETLFATKLWMDGDKLKKGGADWETTNYSTSGTYTRDYYVLDQGTYYLDEDITVDHTIYVTGSADLCLNGHSITYGAEGGATEVIQTNDSSARLRLTDCKDAGAITHKTGTYGPGVSVRQSSTFELYNGSITGNNNYGQHGGGVSVRDGGHFNMYNGKITGNYAQGNNTGDYNGGGVYLWDYSGTSFAMYGGEISGNRANLGGGVYVDSAATATVSGAAKITGNVTGGELDADTGKYTGGTADNVYLYSGKKLTISGELTGEIGVTVRTAPTADSPVEIATGAVAGKNYSEIVKSDKGGYGIVNDNGTLKLSVVEHKHDLCGKTHTPVGDHQTAQEIDFQPWAETNKLPNTAGNYYLTANVELDSYWKPKSGTVLCLNGYSITLDKDTKQDHGVIYVTGGFTLADCKGEQGEYGKITHGKDADGTPYDDCGVTVRSGNFTMYGGNITGNETRSWAYGCGVYVGHWNNDADGTFTMYGGKISGNKARSFGGGVYAADNFTMYGGEISDNEAGDGGGVYVSSGGTFTMNGGTISNNEATYSGYGIHGAGGGGVFVEYAGRFTMEKGLISKNKYTGTGSYPGGGGVYVQQMLNRKPSTDPAFTMKGGTISDNETNYAGGGVYVGEYNLFTMEGGTISNNKAFATSNNGRGEGGGVYVYGSFTMRGGEISGNNCDGSNYSGYLSGDVCRGGGVYVATDDDAAMTVSGNVKITGNTKSPKSGNSEKDNVYLPGKTITIGGALTGEAGSIGVTTSETPTEKRPVIIANNVTTDYSGKFASDKEGFEVKYDNGNLVLGLKGSDPQPGKVDAGVKITAENANDPAPTEVVYGDTFKLGTTLQTTGTAGRPITNDWFWSSSDSSVLEVTGSDSTATVKALEPGEATITVTYESEGAKGRATATIKVNRREISVKVDDKEMTVGGALPTFTVTYGNFVSGDTAATVLETKTPSTTADGKTAGTFDITVEAPTIRSDCRDKYTVGALEKGTLTVKAASTPSTPSTPSSGSSSGSSTITKTETTTNPDGSVTKTETKSDGTVIETTTNPDGSTSKTESKTTTKSNGSTVETVTETNTGADGSKSTSKTETTTAKDGSKTETKSETKTEADGTKSETKSETKTDANGVTSGTETTKTTAPNGSTGTTTTITENGNTKTEAEAKVSEKAIEDAKKSGEAVKVPTEVKAGENSNSAPTVKVELPKNAGKTKIEIPVSDVNSGTVAVIVHPDGTEEIVKDSKPTADGVELTVDGSATVKVIDNSKDFIDTRNHWSRDEVNFVVSREIFNGVGGNLFGVGQPMTRGMVNTVLARLAGIDTTPSAGQKWYEVGTEWAKSQGITDGTNPEASVTREQLATLLYRFCGTPTVSGVLSFADAGEVSDYAQSALLWATQNDILNGVGNNRVAPNADAQRAQVAAMMARYLKNVG